MLSAPVRLGASPAPTAPPTGRRPASWPASHSPTTDPGRGCGSDTGPVSLPRDSRRADTSRLPSASGFECPIGERLQRRRWASGAVQELPADPDLGGSHRVGEEAELQRLSGRRLGRRVRQERIRARHGREPFGVSSPARTCRAARGRLPRRCSVARRGRARFFEKSGTVTSVAENPIEPASPSRTSERTRKTPAGTLELGEVPGGRPPRAAP